MIKLLTIIGEESLPILEKMSSNAEINRIRLEAIKALDELGEKALPILKNIDDNDFSNIDNARKEAIDKINKEFLLTSERISKNENIDAKKIINPIEKENKLEILLSPLFTSKKPLFATPETKELAEKINRVEEIVKKLKQRYKNNFIGIVISGSTAKGYSTKESDIDYRIIAKNEKITKYFKKLAEQQQLKLCDIQKKPYIDVDKKNQIILSQEILFHGIFFGDQQQLHQLQKKFLESINEKEWDEIRERIRDAGVFLIKAKERYNLTSEKLEEIKQFISLLRVPPILKEMLEIIQRRTQKQDLINNQS